MEEKENLVNEEEDLTILLTLTGEDKDTCSWYYDNGANNHMCGYTENLWSLMRM